MPSQPKFDCDTQTKVSPRVLDLIDQMSVEEKVAQLISYWVDQPHDGVAPMQDEMVLDDPYGAVVAYGLGHLTRVYGTTPVEPKERAKWLEAEQQLLRKNSGHDIGAIIHEECLTGLAAWQATTYPTPLAWGASFNPELVKKMAAQIGSDMAKLGIHQGLAPVLDVVRDPRWGRTEESISEDPYLVGTIATAYVMGMQKEGVDATLKHFVGYSGSKAGRNHAPVSAGPREMAEVFLPPFEMAVVEGGVRSVMNSYSEIDGQPVVNDHRYLTDLLRGEWGFDGTVVADYYAVAFLETMHRVAANREDAATQTLTAGLDVELPVADAYPSLVEAVREGRLREECIDVALGRVLDQKERLGLLDPQVPLVVEDIDLDTPENRAVAKELAAQSLILLSNDGVLPLGKAKTIAVVGPNADSKAALMGCYSFENHVLAHYPDVPSGIEIPTVLEALKAEFSSAKVLHSEGSKVEGNDTSGFASAVAVADKADVVVAVVGDRAGLFGRGTVGEGNDTESLRLPGVQRELVETLVETGKPVVLVLLTGRPYELDWALDGDVAPAAVLQAFFPGEEGSNAIAEVLSGKVNPSGHLPVSLPRSAGAQPFTYMHPHLGGPNEVTSVDTTPVRPFGFGLSYTDFTHYDLAVPEEAEAGTPFTVEVTVKNTGEHAGTDTVQLYGRDLVGSVTRPTAQLLAYSRVSLEAGESKKIRFDVPATRLSLIDRDLKRIVEPGEFELWVGADSSDKAQTASLTLTGDVYEVTRSDARRATAEVVD